jgi:hypothetical protein
LGVLAATPEWERWVVLAPAFVVGIGLIIGVLILLGRGLAQSIRESGHTRLIMLGLVIVAGAVVLMTYLGVSLPRE